MRMDSISRMLAKNFDRACLIFGIPCAHPQQQAAILNLRAQIARMMIADPSGQDGTEDAAGSALSPSSLSRRKTSPFSTVASLSAQPAAMTRSPRWTCRSSVSRS